MPRKRDGPDVYRRRLLRALAAGASVSVAGCSGENGDGGDGGGTARGPGDRSFIAGTTSGAQSLSPAVISDEATDNRLNLLYDTGGVVDDDDIGFEGRLLESWSLSDDARRVTYTVRDGLEWGAGYGQLTAEDYVYTARNLFLSDWANYSQRPFFYLGGEPIQYERTGRLTFEARLPQRRPNWLHEDVLYGVYPLPKELIRKYEPTDGGEGDIQGLNRDEAITSGDLNGNLGPFDLVSWEKGQRMVVTRNEDYYLADTDVDDGAFRGSPALDNYTYQVFDERTTGYSAIKAGDITSIGVEARKVSELSGASGVKLWNSEFGSGIFWLNLNFRANGWPPLRRSRTVRQAMAHLLDRSTLIDQIFDGNANPVDTFHPRWGPYYDDEKIVTFEPSTETARRKLREGTSGDYGYNARDEFVGPDGEQVELKLVIDNTSQQGEIVGNFMRQRLEAVGIGVTIDGLPFNRIITTYMHNSVQNNPDYSGEPAYKAGPYNAGPPEQAVSKEPWDIIYGVGFSTSPYAPWQPIKGTLTPRATFNFTGYRTDDYDIAGTIAEAPSASPERTQRMMTDLFGFLSRDQPFVWAFNEHNNVAYRQGVQNLPEAENFFDSPNVRLLSLGTAESGTPAPDAVNRSEYGNTTDVDFGSGTEGG
ncbi:MAG: ABC transporter substrate-binding protein [Haloferacaceae archaeon]